MGPWAAGQQRSAEGEKWQKPFLIVSDIHGIKMWTGVRWKVLPCRIDTTGLEDYVTYPLKHFSESGWELASP